MDIKLRYTWRRKSDGKLEQAAYTIEEIETDPPDIKHENWELIARDLFTGEKDQNGNDIYNGDSVEYEWYDGSVDHWQNSAGTVIFINGGFTPLPGENKRNFKIIKPK